jgi:hypothetical protein
MLAIQINSIANGYLVQYPPQQSRLNPQQQESGRVVFCKDRIELLDELDKAFKSFEELTNR